MLVFILAASAALSIGYCVVLERLHDIYTPDHIWVTVALGNAFILGSAAICAWLNLLQWQDVGIFFLMNAAWGVPVISWQLWQAARRRRQLERKS